jgi:thymidine phosphorylase
MLRAAGLETSKARAIRRLQKVVGDGAALDTMRRIVESQGGDARVVDEPDRLALSRYRTTVVAPRDGHVTEIDPLELGYASMGLGAGRMRAQDDVDPGAGIRLQVQLGDWVHAGDELATLYCSKRALMPSAERRVAAAIRLGARRPPARPRIMATIRR